MSIAGSVSKLSCLCDPGYQCTYSKAVRVNITLPLTQSQFELVRAQFLQAIAAAAGVDASQVSILGQTTLAAPQVQNQTVRRRTALWDSGPVNPHYELLVEVHISGVKHVGVHRLRRGLLLRGMHAKHAEVRQAHGVHVAKRLAAWGL